MILGWGVPFLWAGIWAAITVPWVRHEMHRERVSWEEETKIMESTMLKPPVLPSGAANAEGKTSESSTLDNSTTQGPPKEAENVEPGSTNV